MPRLKMPPTSASELDLIDEMLVDWVVVGGKRKGQPVTDAAKKNARYSLAAFARWLTARDATLLTATPKQCQTYIDERVANVKAVTAAKNWSELRAFYATAEDDITRPLGGRRSPMAGIVMPDHPKFPLTYAATATEAAAVIDSFDMRTFTGLRDATMVSLMFRSGLRVGEVSRLDLRDLNLEGRTVFLGLTKNGEERLPPLARETMKLLTKYVRVRADDVPGRPLFVNLGRRRASERMPVNAIQNIVKRGAATAGVPQVHPHSLRRGFVVHYLSNGGDIPTLMIIGGWSKETMIVRYMGRQRFATAQTVFDAVDARSSNEMVNRLRHLRSVG